MPRIACILACLVSLVLSVSLCAQEQPDVQALVSILSATDVEAAARYFPPELQGAVTKLPKEMREELNRDLPLTEAARRENVSLQFSAEGSPFVVFDDPKGGFISHLEIYIDTRQYGNDQSELTFHVQDRRDSTDPEIAILRLKYVYPDWRVYEAESPKNHEVIRLDDETLVEKMIDAMREDNESSARSQISYYASEIISYAAMFPRSGFPERLDQLGPPEEFGEADENHAGLLSESRATPPFEYHRYRFTYEKKGADRFTIVARPLKFGITGRLSFFIDESQNIRFTEKDQVPDSRSKLLE